MKKYELMAIIVNNVDEKVAQDVAKSSVLDRITEFGGKKTFEDFWGARGFAYKINGEKWGYYFVCQFEIDGKNIAKLERELNIDTKIVRFLVTSVDNGISPEKYEDIQARAKAANVKTEEPTTPAEPKESSTKVTPEKEVSKTEPKKDAVNKKLDQIMDAASAEL